MVKYILTKLAIMLITIFFVSIVVFIIIELPPGDFADNFAAEKASAGETLSQSDVENLKERYGLNQSVYERYFKWIWGIVSRGDFGTSFRYNRPVMMVIGERITFTTCLALLNATWNFFSKKKSGDYSVMVTGLALSHLIILPVTLVLMAIYGLDPKAIPVILLSGLFAGLNTLLLVFMYESSDISMAYPVTRGTGVMFCPGCWQPPHRRQPPGT